MRIETREKNRATNRCEATDAGAKSGKHHPRLGVHFQVVTTSVTVRFGSRGDQLDNGTPFGGAQGSSLTSTDDVIELVWPDADIWASAVSGNASQVAVEISGGRLA